MEQRVVTVIGGTGFVGRYVVKLLAMAGYTIRVIARRPDLARALKTSGNVGQIVLMSGNIAEPESLRGKIEDSYAVINLTGLMFESGKQSFFNVHERGAEKLAQMAKAAGVKHFIHMSALGVDKAHNSTYARSKLLGEKAVFAAFPEATILRPSVIFGPEDRFFNQFAAMASLSPALPLLGGGHTKFQPVYVGDVASAIAACITRPNTSGQIYELGGPHIFTFREILEYIMLVTGKQRRLIPIPLSMASLASFGFELLPQPPLTRDQVELLKYDNVVNAGAKTFGDLGINPTAVDVVVPESLSRFHKKAA